MSPQNEFGDAVIPPGGTWTSPDGVRIAVGAVSASGAVVTVTGGATPPTAPGVPVNVSASGGDGAVRLSWDPPASNGGATVHSYVVTGSPGGISQTVLTGATTTVEQLTNGVQYSFTVKAVNSVGAGAASAVVTATPAAQLPSVTLTSPVGGATVGGAVTITAAAAEHPVSGEDVDLVVFEVDGQAIDWDFEAPYSTVWQSAEAGDGPHTLTATVIDVAWRSATSAPVEVTVATPRPTIAITQPADNEVVTDDIVTLRATAAPAPDGGAPIQWVTYELADGTTVGYAGAEAPYEAQWDTTALNGAYQVVAKVYDADGRSGVSAPVHLTLQHPAPSVAITSPGEDESVQGSAVPVTADATPSPVSGAAIGHVEFHADGLPIGYDADAPYEVLWDTGSLTGAHLLTATAYDVDGRVATSVPRSVDVDNPVPSAVVTSPGDGAVVTAQVTLAATAEPNPDSGAAIERVVLTVDGAEVADIAAPGPYTTTWNPGQSYGEHTVVATAHDAAGRAGASAPVTFTVPSPAPSAAFTSPVNGATVAITGSPVDVYLATEPDPQTGSPVDYGLVYVDGVLIGGEVLEGGVVTAQWWPTPGQHVISATVYDLDGWSGDATGITVTAAELPGAPTGVVAVAGQNGTATVSWTAPTEDGGSPVTGYVVARNGEVQQLAAGSPHVFTGLANGATYYFAVAATTAAGAGPFSAVSNAVVPGVRTALSIAVTPTTVAYGRPVTTTGVLKRTDTGAVIAGKRVQLLSCVPGTLTCSTVTSAVTTTAGKVTMSYVPRLHRDLRLRFLTSGPYVTSTSVAKRVKVAVVVSSAISRTSMPLGYTATVSGKVVPSHAGKRVYLQRLTSTGWKSVAYKNLGSTSAASFAVKPTSRAAWRYRLWFPGDADHLGAASASRAVTVY